MSPADRELLVIVSHPSAGSDGAGIPDRFPVVHSMSSRVFVIELPGDTSSEDLTALPGVTTVGRNGATPEILEGLDETEVLFVQAWLEREGDVEARTQRRADGFDWDADGFEPPDPSPGFDVGDRSA